MGKSTGRRYPDEHEGIYPAEALHLAPVTA